jgi:hypothetical protein
MATLINQNGKVSYGVEEYVADSLAEITKLPTSCSPGSTCFVIENSSVWMLNGQKVWV